MKIKKFIDTVIANPHETHDFELPSGFVVTVRYEEDSVPRVTLDAEMNYIGKDSMAVLGKLLKKLAAKLFELHGA